MIVKFLSFLEDAAYYIIILFFSGAVLGVLFSDHSGAGLDSGIARTLWYPIYMLVALLGVLRLPRLLRMTVFSPIIVTCVLWCGLSLIWSVNPDVSLRRAIALMMTTMAGLLIAARYDWNGMVQRFAFAYFTLAFIAFLIVLFDPTRGIDYHIHYGAWRGPWPEKNTLGGNMTKGLVLAICAFAMRPDRFWIWVPAGLACFALVILSTSKTALLISLASIGMFMALRLFRRYPIMRIPITYIFVTGIVGFVTLMLVIPDEMFGLIGKDATFTGRTDIWHYLSVSIKEEFLLGYGYGVYWMDPMGPSYATRAVLEWGVPSAHNGWIESWLSGGVVLVSMFAVHYFIVMILAFNRIKHGGVETYWAILSTLFFFAFSMSESTILQQNELSWVLFVATSAKLMSFERPYWRNRAQVPYFLQRVVKH